MRPLTVRRNAPLPTKNPPAPCPAGDALPCDSLAYFLHVAPSTRPQKRHGTPDTAVREFLNNCSAHPAPSFPSSYAVCRSLQSPGPFSPNIRRFLFLPFAHTPAPDASTPPRPGTAFSAGKMRRKRVLQSDMLAVISAKTHKFPGRKNGVLPCSPPPPRFGRKQTSLPGRNKKKNIFQKIVP